MAAHSPADLAADFPEGEFYVVVYDQDVVWGNPEEPRGFLYGNSASVHEGLRLEKDVGKLFQETGMEFGLPGICKIHPFQKPVTDHETHIVSALSVLDSGIP